MTAHFTLSQFWDVLAGALALSGDAFRQTVAVPTGLTPSLLVVFVAGLSLAIGQSFVLFVNRVTPVRFALSLLISAALFVVGYLVLVLSAWLITLLPWSIHVPLHTILVVFAMSYAPILFGCFGALPYFGRPLLWGLSIWHLLALVVGFSAVGGIPLFVAAAYVAFGWGVVQIAQHTIGQPLANLGRGIANAAAGVTLATESEEIVAAIEAELKQASSREQRRATSVQPVHTLQDPARSRSVLGVLIGLTTFAIVAYIIMIMLAPMHHALFGFQAGWPRLIQFIFDLAWIGVIAFVVAAFMAPLETLGYWAGWYGETVNTAAIGVSTTVSTGAVATAGGGKKISRYLVYLDGISQSSSHYLPDVETFLDALVKALPADVALIRGLMTYSVFNKPLDEDKAFGFLWALLDKVRFAHPASVLGMFINLRNITIVSVSADSRYGPLYNLGIAQVIYDALMAKGYKRGSGVPVTLIGYSGGGQMSAASAAFLKMAIKAPVDVISLAGVMSGTADFLQIESFEHLFGDKDSVQRFGEIIFASRWKIFSSSNWNKARKLGKIRFVLLGPVGHQVPGGLLDPAARLPDGRSNLQQTIDDITHILASERAPSAASAAPS
jgi:hypothetical protein